MCVCLCSLTKSLTKPARNFPGKSTRVGYHLLPQEISPTQGLNLSQVQSSASPPLTGRFFTIAPPGMYIHMYIHMYIPYI